MTLAATVTPLAEHVTGTSRRGLILLLAAVLAVLLIACSNLANLSLTRSLARVRETAIRAALGASSARLVRRAVMEQLLLSVAGGALGIWVAWAALALFVRTAPLDLPRVNDVALDARAIAFTATVALFAGAIVAIVPALRLAGHDLQTILRAGVAAASARGRLRSHTILLTAQIGLSVTLLVVAALFGASSMRVLNVNRGFTSDNVLAVDIALPAARYGEETGRQAVYDRLLAAIRVLPGVESVATTSMLPLRGQGQVNFIAREGSTAPTSELPTANFRFVAPDFFRTLGITVERGRPFTDAERNPRRPAPALVSRATASRLWPGQNAALALQPRHGHRAVLRGGRRGRRRADDVARSPAALDGLRPLLVAKPIFRLAADQDRRRAGVDGRRGAPRRPRSIPRSPSANRGRSRSSPSSSLAGRRYQARLFIVFGAVGLFIAVIGVYAVTAFGTVTAAAQDGHFRVALGARRAQVIGLVLRRG